MRFFIIGDLHYSKYSSILRSRGELFSVRLENMIKTINWTQQEAEKHNIDMIMWMGDFFDSNTLDAEELTALNEVKWSDTIQNVFIVGNHEMLSHDLTFNSAEVLSTFGTVIKTPVHFVDGNTVINVVPYILESERAPLSDYITKGEKTVVFSHNDIKGIQMGSFVSVSGFDLDEINSSCTRFFNGHLHNGERLSDVAINVGNITGQNFSEDATKYTHQAYIYDTETDSIETIRNPYALNFFKMDWSNALMNASMPINSVVSLTVDECDVSKAKEWASDLLASRINIKYEKSDSATDVVDNLSNQNHIQQFIDFVHSEYGDTDIINYELQKVCGDYAD